MPGTDWLGLSALSLALIGLVCLLGAAVGGLLVVVLRWRGYWDGEE